MSDKTEKLIETSFPQRSCTGYNFNSSGHRNIELVNILAQNNACIVADGWAVIISASVNGIDNCRSHCIAYMANYITPTDPLSQHTCHTMGVHTTRALPILTYIHV